MTGLRPMTGLVADVGVVHGSFVLDVTITVAPGEVVAVVGPNGAGKTTLLRALAGLEPVTSGRVVLDGSVLDDPSTGVFVPAERRPVGVVFQDYLLFEHLSVRDNIAFGLRARHRIRRGEARAEADGWLDRFDLAAHADRRPRALSGGQAQRVALARALATRPGLVLLDEPLAALDAVTRIDVRAYLAATLGATRTPVVLVTHDPLDAMTLADRLVVLEGGRIVQEGPPPEIARRPRTDYVARLVGLNLFRGRAAGGVVTLPDSATLRVPAGEITGEVLVAIRPSAVAVHLDQPHGSPRNVLSGRVTSIEQFGERVRVGVGSSPPMYADITTGALADLRLVAGTPVWVAIKATDLDVYPAGVTGAAAARSPEPPSR